MCIRDSDAPEGLLALVYGFDAGVALVDAPGVAAVGFTGSVPAGRALWTRANTRATPIPLSLIHIYVPAADLAKMGGLQWESPNFDAAKGPLVMPLETQFYIGFYNKKLFKEAGLSLIHI